jgi:hypothetical protein
VDFFLREARAGAPSVAAMDVTFSVRGCNASHCGTVEYTVGHKRGGGRAYLFQS